METKFSKGPLKINKDDAASILDANGNEIAEVFQDFGPWEHDAVLMAEAPNMFKALHQSIALMGPFRGMLTKDGEALIASFEEVLAKARGES